jgi:hypothetical protein
MGPGLETERSSARGSSPPIPDVVSLVCASRLSDQGGRVDTVIDVLNQFKLPAGIDHAFILISMRCFSLFELCVKYVNKELFPAELDLPPNNSVLFFSLFFGTLTL